MHTRQTLCQLSNLSSPHLNSVLLLLCNFSQTCFEGYFGYSFKCFNKTGVQVSPRSFRFHTIRFGKSCVTYFSQKTLLPIHYSHLFLHSQRQPLRIITYSCSYSLIADTHLLFDILIMFPLIYFCVSSTLL